MKLRKNKKGFTIVELVIVIAVIGVLAAVLIPTFINLNNKANKAADESLVKNLNTALATQEQMLGDKPNDTMNDAVEDLMNYGYLLPNLVTKSEDKLLWNKNTNRFLLEKDVKIDDKNKKVDYWRIQDNLNEQEYSVYAGVGFNATEITGLKVGFDAGDKEGISSVSYVGNGTSAQDVVIRTNSITTNVTINAEQDTVRHYGEGKVVNLQAVSTSSYYENGKVNQVNIKKGRLVLSNAEKSSVGTVYLQATGETYDNIIVATQEGAKLPELFARDNVPLPTGEDSKTVLVIQTNVNEEGKNPTKVETINLYSAKDVKESTNGYNVSDLGLLVVEAISSEAKTEAAEQISDPEVLEKVEEAKSTVEVGNETQLKQALDNKSKYISLIDNFSINAYIPVLYSTTIDGQGHIITANSGATRMIRVGADDVELILRNITLNGDNKSERGFQVDSNKTVKLELDNVVISGITYYAINFCAGTKVDMTLSDSNITGWAAINAYGSGNKLLVSNTTLTGINPHSGTSNSFATVCLEGDSTSRTDLHSSDYIIDFVNCTFNVSRTGDQIQTVIGFNTHAINSSVGFSKCKFNIGQGCRFGYDFCGNNSNSIIIDGEELDYTRGTYFDK